MKGREMGERTVVEDAEGDERIEDLEDDGRLHHAIVVQFAERLDGADPSLVVLGVVDFHANPDVLQHPIHDPRSDVILKYDETSFEIKKKTEHSSFQVSASTTYYWPCNIIDTNILATKFGVMMSARVGRLNKIQPEDCIVKSCFFFFFVKTSCLQFIFHNEMFPKYLGNTIS